MNEPRTIGRYRIFDEIASGGMGTVHYGRMSGAGGFARTVAIKRLHPQYSKSPEFVEGLIDEARVAARIRHPNVVATLDVLAEDGEMLLVMEYVEGVTLSHLMRELGREGLSVPLPVAIGIATAALYGLHAAHEATGEDGVALEVVHRDVSPQNVIVGVDGVARVVDFGVAKAVGRLQTTTDGRIKGKIAYMPPEQLRGRPVDRRADVYAAGVVLWELIAGRRLFRGDSDVETMTAVLEQRVPRLGEQRADVPGAVDDVLAKAMARDLGERTGSARAMAVALEGAVQPASLREIGEWLASVAKGILAERRAVVAAIESASASGRYPVAPITPTSSKQEPVQTADALSNIDYTIGVTAAVAPAKSRRAIAIGAAATLLVLAGAGSAFTVSRVRASAEPKGTRPPAAESPPPATSPVASVPPPPPAPSSAELVASAPAASSAPPPKPPSLPPKQRPVDCNPPFTLDASGARHWKKGC